jgi:hypothetical protein
MIRLCLVATEAANEQVLHHQGKTMIVTDEDKLLHLGELSGINDTKSREGGRRGKSLSDQSKRQL